MMLTHSVNFYLVVSADSKLMCWDCVFHKDGNSSLCSAFSIKYYAEKPDSLS